MIVNFWLLTSLKNITCLHTTNCYGIIVQKGCLDPVTCGSRGNCPFLLAAAARRKAEPRTWPRLHSTSGLVGWGVGEPFLMLPVWKSCPHPVFWWYGWGRNGLQLTPKTSGKAGLEVVRGGGAVPVPHWLQHSEEWVDLALSCRCGRSDPQNINAGELPPPVVYHGKGWTNQGKAGELPLVVERGERWPANQPCNYLDQIRFIFWLCPASTFVICSIQRQWEGSVQSYGSQ